MARITFLGTGGGRHATIYQTRGTGGLVIDSGDRIHVDPGPSAAANMRTAKLDPADTDCILVSHCHPDHYSEAEIMIEGMCKGCSERRGTVAGSESVLDGVDTIGPCISRYHRTLAGRYVTLRPGDVFNPGRLRVDVTRSSHSDPTTIGFRFDTLDGIVSYVSDTSYSDEIADQYLGSRVLILPITTPDGRRIPYHMCTDDAVSFVGRIRPELTILSHMGQYMIKVGPEAQAKKVADATGCNVIAGRDLMTIDIESGIRIDDLGL
jgi:phosphoribosyl 1,2-cyclic phosphodiesterase